MYIDILVVILAASMVCVPSTAHTTRATATSGPPPHVTSRGTTPTGATSVTTAPTGGTPGEEHPVEVIGEFENALTPQQKKQYKVSRGAASNGYTLRLTQKDIDMAVAITLCVKGDHDSEQVRVVVSNIFYSNDGPADTIAAFIDGRSIGTAVTENISDGGNGWNLFKGTGAIWEPVSLTTGNHTLVVRALADEWGIELDYIEVNAYHQNSNVMILCEATLDYFKQ